MIVYNALVTMNHRAGFINGEGDGVGIHIDFRRPFGKKNLKTVDIIQRLLTKKHFIVGHVFINKKENGTL